jgi:hypothetical protein
VASGDVMEESTLTGSANGDLGGEQVSEDATSTGRAASESEAAAKGASIH